jgi:hypothetical protein
MPIIKNGMGKGEGQSFQCHPVHMLYRSLYYYHLTDINTEIEEVILNFNLCRLKECKLRSHINWQEMFKPKRH